MNLASKQTKKSGFLSCFTIENFLEMFFGFDTIEADKELTVLQEKTLAETKKTQMTKVFCPKDIISRDEYELILPPIDFDVFMLRNKQISNPFDGEFYHFFNLRKLSKGTMKLTFAIIHEFHKKGLEDLDKANKKFSKPPKQLRENEISNIKNKSTVLMTEFQNFHNNQSVERKQELKKCQSKI